VHFLSNGINSDGLLRSEFNETLPKRFALKCGQPDKNGCIPWLAYKTQKGYGVLRTASTHSRKTCAHRIAWVLAKGDLPPKVLVLHRCDNPSCVNVDHLFLGSPQTNVDDMVSKKRHAWRHALPWQKLNAVDGERVRDLRRARHTQQEVADWLGVSRPLISMIESGKIQHSSLSI
jgi:hypothetical protein